MRDSIVNAIKANLIGQINKSIANIEIMLDSRLLMPDHIDAVEKELDNLGHLDSKLQMLGRYVIKPDDQQAPDKKPIK
tara:strand:+ start:698 stop:931 length:234 start_codon:yes stop_codon:yes gene_type:complete